MELYSYANFPEGISDVHVALFTSVSNAAQIRSRIIKASTMSGSKGDEERDAVNFAFIEAKLVTSRLALQTAIYQSMLADVQSVLKTKTVHSEIVWYLNPTNNITEALRRFGVSDNSSSLFVVKVGPKKTKEDVEVQMRAVINGEVTPFSMLSSITDWSAIKKYYKLNGDPAIASLEQDQTRQNMVVDELVTSFIAMKPVMA